MAVVMAYASFLLQKRLYYVCEQYRFQTKKKKRVEEVTTIYSSFICAGRPNSFIHSSLCSHKNICLLTKCDSSMFQCNFSFSAYFNDYWGHIVNRNMLDSTIKEVSVANKKLRGHSQSLYSQFLYVFNYIVTFISKALKNSTVLVSRAKFSTSKKSFTQNLARTLRKSSQQLFHCWITTKNPDFIFNSKFHEVCPIAQNITKCFYC